MGNFDRNDRNTRGGGRSFGRRDFGPRSFGGDRSSGGRSDRPKFSAVCSNCGKDCEVPFRPTNGKPVYCSDCFEKMRGGSTASDRFQSPESRGSVPSFDPNRSQLDAISNKLDRIIKLLEPKTEAPVKVVPAETTKVIVPEEIKEKIVPKVKKVSKKASSKKAE